MDPAPNDLRHSLPRHLPRRPNSTTKTPERKLAFGPVSCFVAARFSVASSVRQTERDPKAENQTPSKVRPGSTYPFHEPPSNLHIARTQEQHRRPASGCHAKARRYETNLGTTAPTVPFKGLP